MNEELIKAIHGKFYSTTDYETFKTDFSNTPELRRAIHTKYLADKSSYNDFEIDLGFKQPPVTRDVDDDFSNTLKDIPVAGGLLNAGYKALKRAINTGLSQGSSLGEGMDALFKGNGLTDDEVQAIALITQKTKEETEGDNSLSAKYSRGEDMSLAELGGAFAEIAVQSGAGMVRGLLDAFTNSRTAGIIAGTAGAGAAAGSVIPGLGTLSGGIGGTLTALSGTQEAAGILFGDINQTLSEKGLPINSKNVNLFWRMKNG